MELFNVLARSLIQYNKLCIRVASQVAERIATESLRLLQNIVKAANLGEDSLPSR